MNPMIVALKIAKILHPDGVNPWGGVITHRIAAKATQIRKRPVSDRIIFVNFPVAGDPWDMSVR